MKSDYYGKSTMSLNIFELIAVINTADIIIEAIKRSEKK